MCPFKDVFLIQENRRTFTIFCHSFHILMFSSVSLPVLAWVNSVSTLYESEKPTSFSNTSNYARQDAICQIYFKWQVTLGIAMCVQLQK